MAEMVKSIYSHLGANGILLESFPFQSEAVMEAFLCENPVILSLERLDEPVVIDRQIQWNKDDKTGRIDMLISFGSEYAAVVELKNGCLTMAHVDQLESYLGNDLFLKKRAESLPTDSAVDIKWFGVLVGVDVENKLLLKVLNGDFKTKNDIPIGFIILSRFKGGDQSFILPIVYPPVLKNKPPLYRFNGIDYKTSQLTHAMLKDYVEKHFNDVSFSRLVTMLGGIKAGKAIIELWDEKREADLEGYYYTRPSLRIPLHDGNELVVRRWWSLEEINKITSVASVLNCKFSKV